MHLALARIACTCLVWHAGTAGLKYLEVPLIGTRRCSQTLKGIGYTSEMHHQLVGVFAAIIGDKLDARVVLPTAMAHGENGSIQSVKILREQLNR